MKTNQPEQPTREDYKILNLKPEATLAELRTSFRKLVFECHSDVVGDNPEFAKRFNSIVEARNRIEAVLKEQVKLDETPPPQPDLKDPREIAMVFVNEAKNNPGRFKKCLDALADLEKKTGENFVTEELEILSDFVYGLADSARTVMNTRIFIMQVLKIREIDKKYGYGFDMVAGDVVKDRLKKLRLLAEKFPMKKPDTIASMFTIISSVYPEILNELMEFLDKKI